MSADPLVPLVITFHSYGPPLWVYSVEHVIADAMLDVAEHDDEEAINVTQLRYEDLHFPNESAALEMLFRSVMTWKEWALVMDTLHKVFKGDYVALLFNVVMRLPQAKVRYLGNGRLYHPNDA